MKRVMVMGCSGAGKSTFAKRLGAALGLPVIHLDALYWTPGWVPAEAEDFRARARAAHAGDAWVSDGNFTTLTGDFRIPRAEAIIWIDQPRWLCLARAILRAVGNHGRTRADLGAGCPERIDPAFLMFIWNFRRQSQPRQFAAIATHGGDHRLTVLKGDKAVGAYLAALSVRAAEVRA